MYIFEKKDENKLINLIIYIAIKVVRNRVCTPLWIW